MCAVRISVRMGYANQPLAFCRARHLWPVGGYSTVLGQPPALACHAVGRHEGLRPRPEFGRRPNHARLMKRWEEPYGVTWKPGRLIPARGVPMTHTRKNHWLTPLSCAQQVARHQAMIDRLLSAGADPWSPGNGPDQFFGPGLIHEVLLNQLSSSIVGLLDKHMTHVVDCYLKRENAATLSPSSRMEDLKALASGRQAPGMAEWLDRFEASLLQRALESGTAHTHTLRSRQRL